MSVILILLAASLSIAVCFLLAFIWSVKSGQYEDDYTPSVRMLFDETPDNNANNRARDADGLALFCESKKSRSEAEPGAARPDAQINKNNHTK